MPALARTAASTSASSPLEKEVPREPDAHAPDPVVQPGQEVVERQIARDRIERVVGGERSKEARDIRHGARHRADGVVRDADRRDAADRDAPMGGAQARDARHRGRNPHRAAGIRAERGVGHLGRDGGAGAAAGAPGNALRVPRIAALAEHRVGREHTPGKLLHVCLADQYRALGLQPARPRERRGWGCGRRGRRRRWWCARLPSRCCP